MTLPFGRAARRLRDWVARRSVWTLAALAVLGAAGASAGGYYAYRTYDWVEHDNDFCLSCHLMQQPYELFAESDHRGLGCKACHKPTFAARSQMALTQVLANPDSLTTHAEVPNDKCADCHIGGDPERWETIRNSAGHRVHLESEDTALVGLMCVECHSSSLHQFAATDETCGQSGCHTDVRVALGTMANLAIHCAACHAFSAPLEDTASVETARFAMAPAGDECLSCHVMRTLVEMPPDEPHQGVCSTCHNPHEQETPAQAVESCAAACHAAPDTLSAFHRGIEHAALDDCSSCHAAHAFVVEGEDCLACHADIFDDVLPSAGGPRAQVPGPDVRRAAAPAGGEAFRFASVRLAPEAYLHAPPPQEVRSDGFRHEEHREVACVSCHDSSESHGTVTVTTQTACRSCHHTRPVVDPCASCHTSADIEGATTSVARPLELSVGTSVVRPLPFDHASHADSPCATCHTDDLARSLEPASCDGCHVEHHVSTGECTACHVPAPDDAHDVQSHLGCTGAGCHTERPFEAVPREGREGCLVCHQELRDHEPAEACIECHALPAPHRGGTP